MIFFTTSTLSDIQQTQSKLISKHFPDHAHILIDGRRGWFDVWYQWLRYDHDSEWIIHIDEDCFVNSPEVILQTIEYMEKNGYDIAGPPDGHHHYRSGNHMALNSFFMIVNKRCIDAWNNRTDIPQFKKEWIEEYPFEKNNSSHYEYDMEFGSSGKPLGQIWKRGTEPYYDFMWVLKDAGMKFLYLEPTFNPEFQTTDLLGGTVQHMWHQRERWSTNIVSSVHTMPNRLRYDKIIERYEKISEYGDTASQN